jgi:hypothetical protein
MSKLKKLSLIVNNNSLDKFLLCYITVEKIDRTTATKHRLLLVKLPFFPESLNELKLIHFWLHAFSQACFELILCYEKFFNPEIIDILFPRRKVKSFTLRCNNEISLVDIPLDAQLGPFISARNISSIRGVDYVKWRNELLPFILSLRVIPKSVSISHGSESSDRQYLIQVLFKN